jgi:competence protein ComEC
VGYGDAILIRDFEASFAMLVDCGDVHVGDGGPGSCRISAADFLKKEGVENLDLLVLTHLHRDHSGGLGQLLSAVSVKTFWTNYLPPKRTWGSHIDVPFSFSAGSRCLLDSLNIYLAALQTMQARGTEILLKNVSGEQVQLTPQLTADLDLENDVLLGRQSDIWRAVLNGEDCGKALDELDRFINNTSIRMRLRYGEQCIELPGDVYAACWEKHQLTPCDIVKVPHHGHGDSMTLRLLKMLQPSCAVISVSNSRSDPCPHPNVLKMLYEQGTNVYFTDAVSTEGTPPVRHTSVRFELAPERKVLPQDMLQAI